MDKNSYQDLQADMLKDVICLCMENPELSSFSSFKRKKTKIVDEKCSLPLMSVVSSASRGDGENRRKITDYNASCSHNNSLASNITNFS